MNLQASLLHYRQSGADEIQDGQPMLIQTITIIGTTIGTMIAFAFAAWRVFTKFLDTFRQGIETSIDGLRSEMNASIDGLRSEMKASYDGLRSEMKADYEGLKTIVQNGTKEHEHFRSSIHDLHTEILALQKEILTRCPEK
ncbi:MAG: hypothetical protein OXE81_06525 [Gammaproteobacteria bacterium]|nr:hypothetical protein [Gammaproteobacteria bacterium]